MCVTENVRVQMQFMHSTAKPMHNGAWVIPVWIYIKKGELGKGEEIRGSDTRRSH